MKFYIRHVHSNVSKTFKFGLNHTKVSGTLREGLSMFYTLNIIYCPCSVLYILVYLLRTTAQ
jgi:hypothetical protein